MAKPKKTKAKTSGKIAKSSASKPAAAPAKAVSIVKAKPSSKTDRMEIPAPDFTEWWDNLKAYAHKSPAGLVVGVIAVWMALVLLFD